MGLLDNLKAKLAPAKEKVEGLAQQHEGRIGEGLDKVAKAVDSKTHGKYSDRITTGTHKAKDALGKLAHKDTPEREAPQDIPRKDTPGGPTPPPAS
ncbi:antitoxin [Streptomyces sp. RerS4]|uniref:antitoxin n=1 Tax=Streptomyces sp. RerS4 TaxID=2942449 RepID=UPI00201C8698|nr:antitoxin [Streptomyces sp. RerS4]UQX03318.1 antitoxin [Streptomyces sp. RerS4]